MRKYEKPVVVVNEGLAEGVYANSGSSVAGLPSCDSKYMNGVYQKEAGGWNVSVKDYYGCLGCPAYRNNGCALQVDEAYMEGATSYDTDNGKRMPAWESLGKTPEYIIDDNHPKPY